MSITILGDATQAANAALKNLELAPGGRRSVRLNDTMKLPATPVLVTADQPVVVERVVNHLKGVGISMTIGIPLRD